MIADSLSHVARNDGTNWNARDGKSPAEGPTILRTTW